MPTPDVLAFSFQDMKKEDCYTIGYISKARGLKGEVTVVLTEPVLLSSIHSVFIELANGLVPFFIESFSERPDKAFIKFEDVNTASEATALKGRSLLLAKVSRPPLKRGDFYTDEVIGFEIRDDQLGVIGFLQNVIPSGPTKLLQLFHDKKEILIPINSPFIRSINSTKKVIQVNLPEGFLDI
jgi:16S rRNA processing protein RimM